MSNKYCTFHYVIALLKAYGIKNIVSSPGTQNSAFNYMVQEDPYFKCYSVVDERSSAYVAIGISQEIKAPVVITCTGATASRNYMSGMTEAYYREIPIIALTFYNPRSNDYNMSPQYLDRNVSPNDIKAVSIHLPEIKDRIDKTQVLTKLNAVLSLAKENNQPIHINCPAIFDFSTKTLPSDIWYTKYYYENFSTLVKELKKEKFAIFIGEHKSFTEEEVIAISDFAVSWGIPVFCDHTANYHGKNKVLISQFRLLNTINLRPKLIIDLGGISGVYNKGGLYNNVEIWRISKNYQYNNRHDKPLTKLLIGLEKTIFESMKNNTKTKFDYYDNIQTKIKDIKFDNIPHSITLVAQQLAKYIPENSSLHLAILRSLESADIFNFPETVDICCNVGGFGIDGPISTALGQSLANPERKVFCLTGDLAFFYDMNILGNRHISNNLRILLINNREGVCMRFNPTLEDAWGDKPGVLVTAAGHFKKGAKDWAISCGFKYMSANNREEFMSQINEFCNGYNDFPIIFEVFTTVNEDKDAVKELRKINGNIPKKNISFAEKIFSVRNEYNGNKKHKIIRILGTKIKINVKKR